MIRIVPVSGGKDSQLVLQLILDSYDRKDVVAVHQNTGYDHPLTYEHLRWMSEYYAIEIHHTRSKKYGDLFNFVRTAGYFPNHGARGCTSRLKQRPFGEWLQENGFTQPNACQVYLGMRADESKQRLDSYGDLLPGEIFSLSDISSEYPEKVYKDVKVQLPIVHLSTENVFDILNRSGVKINPLYEKGHSRVGCYPCLLANGTEWRLAAKDPIGREHITKLLNIEDQFVKENNPRKLIKVHRTRDVRGLLKDADIEMSSEQEAACGWCSI